MFGYPGSQKTRSVLYLTTVGTNTLLCAGYNNKTQTGSCAPADIHCQS